MSKNEKIYHIVSIISLGLHIFVFIFVLIAGFLEYHENQNFYEYFIGFFGDNLSIYQPYFIMAILFLSCVTALLAIKYPPISFFTAVCTLAFFVIETFPYAFDSFFVEITSPYLGSTMPTYGIGFQLMEIASYIIYFDIAFFIYSIITLFIRLKNKINTDKLMQWFFPDNIYSEKTKAVIKKYLSILVILLVTSQIIGLCFSYTHDMVLWNVGRYMILIPSGIIVLMVMGVVVAKIISYFKSNTSQNSEEE